MSREKWDKKKENLDTYEPNFQEIPAIIVLPGIG